MRSGKWNVLPIVLLSAAIAGLTGSGCKKIDGTSENDQIIRTPYGVYFGDRLGSLYNTNDGYSYKLIFPIDGVPTRSIITSGENILIFKRNMALSVDNGGNFNGRTDIPVVIRTGWPSFVANGFNKTFLATEAGIIETADNGLKWEPSTGSSGKPHSIARIGGNGEMFAIDSAGAIQMKDNGTNPWAAVTVVSPFPSGVYHLTNFNNSLIAGDASGANGVWFSADKALNWKPYTGLPTNQEIRCMHSPLGQGLLAGLDSAGIYRLVGSNFEPANSGLAPFTTVYGITSKQDIYKNEIIRQYVYIATSTGLYRSEDLGKNWALMKGGDFRSVY